MSVKQHAQYSTEVKRSQQQFYKLLSLSCNMVILVGTVSLAV